MSQYYRYPVPRGPTGPGSPSQIITPPVVVSGDQSVTLPDSGVASDNLVIGVTLSDSGSVTDNLAVAPILSEGGTGTDNLLANAVTLADSGVVTETLIIGVTLSDSGSAVDNLLANAVTLADSGTTTETLVIGVTLSDSGTAADNLLKNAVTLADSGAADDNLLANAVILADSGVGSDSGSKVEIGATTCGLYITASTPIGDTGTGTEAQAHEDKLLTEKPVGVDSLDLAAGFETGIAFDALQINATATGNDGASASDTLIAPVIILIDSGSACDGTEGMGSIFAPITVTTGKTTVTVGG